ncbi:MAG: CDGSH iron-sulfur domain-containing protein [Oscillospiraceae bacterium]|nr:CDGSH iron-sulfur domain-containing protein [Oscillospiraceae bacterium]
MPNTTNAIKVLPNGPYEVSTDVPLTIQTIESDGRGISTSWREDGTYPESMVPYHLCRCGHSKSKPYCDGAHVSIEFDGTETASRAPYIQRAKKYEGEAVDLLDDGRCASLRFCDRGVRAWDAAIHSGDPANLQLAKEECAACSAGRLTLVDKSGELIEPELPKQAGLVQDPVAGKRGAIKVTGGIELIGADGQPYETRNRYTLCRCGQSRNKPFCDTRHLNCPHMAGHDEIGE